MNRLVDPEPVPCKICGGPAVLHGVVDFHKTAQRGGAPVIPLSGIPVYYRQCGTCGFLFTDLCDGWTPAEMARHIYNDEYRIVDPNYLGPRSVGQVHVMLKLLGGKLAGQSLLDYGGGGGHFAQLLAEAGFPLPVVYDPFVPEASARPGQRFNLITCFEVLEHAVDPRTIVRSWKEFMAEDSMVLFSTTVLPDDFEAQGLDWWYVAPRNGHISLQSARSLAHLAASEGLRLGSFGATLHVVCKSPPAFAAHLFG